jgi:hypothetical protein
MRLVIAVAPGVKQLQHDAAAGCMYRVGNRAMRSRSAGRRELRAMRSELAFVVRREPPVTINAARPARAPHRKRRAARYHRAVSPARVHRAHQDPIRQLDAAQVERFEEMLIGMVMVPYFPAFSCA